MLVKAGEYHQIHFFKSCILCLTVSFCVFFSPSSQKHSLPWLLQVAQEYHQQITNLLFSAKSNHTVLY